MKFIIIMFLVGFILYKTLGFIFSLLGGGQAAGKTRGYTQQHYHKPPPPPPNGNVHVDYVPDKERKDEGKFKGGEYVDFEEVD
jgi:hypothetical protein